MMSIISTAATYHFDRLIVDDPLRQTIYTVRSGATTQ